MYLSQTLAFFALLATSYAATGLDWQQRNYNTIANIYNTTIFPYNQAFIEKGASAVPPGLFNPKASGRITPLGNFSGFEDSVEYFFGLTPPVKEPLFDTWTKAQIVSFTSGCPEVASSVVYGETTGVNPNASSFGQVITRIKQIAFWRFDENGAVLNYDAWLPNLQQYTELLYGVEPNATVNAKVIDELCSGTQTFCTGPNEQYPSKAACIESLMKKPFGTWDEAWGDNVVCRSVHVLLAKQRPEAHCSHVGPTGGGKCVDVHYNNVYFDDQELFGVPAGDTFICDGVAK